MAALYVITLGTSPRPCISPNIASALLAFFASADRRLVRDHIGHKSSTLHLAQQLERSGWLLAFFASADGRAVRDHVRHKSSTLHLAQQLERSGWLLAFFASADGRIVRDHVRHKSSTLHLAQQLERAMPLPLAATCSYLLGISYQLPLVCVAFMT